MTVNVRVRVPEAAAASLRALYATATEAGQAAEFALVLVCQTLGVDRTRVVGFDGETAELVLEEVDPERLPSVEEAPEEGAAEPP